jgi:hypothetical protein
MYARHKAARTAGRHGVRRLFALVLLLPTIAVLGAQASPAAATEVCPGTHLSPPDSTTESFTYTAPAGYLVAGWCVKAGTTAENHDLSGAPVASVTIEHSSGKDISHYSVILVKAPTPVAPAAATAVDVCEPATGPTDDRITIPVDASFTYTLDGTAVAAGPVVATGTTHTVVAVAKAGVVVQEGATTTWTFTFTKVLCVTPPPPPPPPAPPVTPPVTPPVVPPVVTPPVVAPEVLPEQAFGKAVGSVKASCQGTVRARLANRSGETVVYKLRVGKKVHEIAVKSQSKKKFVTKGQPRAKVTLKVGSTRLDKLRIPALCVAPEVLPDTGLRGTSS